MLFTLRSTIVVTVQDDHEIPCAETTDDDSENSSYQSNDSGAAGCRPPAAVDGHQVSRASDHAARNSEGSYARRPSVRAKRQIFAGLRR